MSSRSQDLEEVTGAAGEMSLSEFLRYSVNRSDFLFKNIPRLKIYKILSFLLTSIISTIFRQSISPKFQPQLIYKAFPPRILITQSASFAFDRTR